MSASTNSRHEVANAWVGSVPKGDLSNRSKIASPIDHSAEPRTCDPGAYRTGCSVGGRPETTPSFGASTILGRRIVKVEPRPTSLSTVMSPPPSERTLDREAASGAAVFVGSGWWGLGANPSATPNCQTHLARCFDLVNRIQYPKRQVWVQCGHQLVRCLCNVHLGRNRGFWKPRLYGQMWIGRERQSFIPLNCDRQIGLKPKAYS